MRADSDIQRDVEREVRWDPAIESADIGISVRNGVVVLTGFVRSYAELHEAESDAKRVAGVMAIADELKIRLPAPDVRPDSEIARNAVLALASQVPYLSGVTPIVHAGEVTLEGEVEWGFQREKAESVVRGLRGVTAVTNLIRVVPRTPTDTVKTEIEQALRRHAELDAGHIVVETRGNRIILRGWVHTLAEREEAERAAWRAPGATHVDNQLSVGEPVESG